MTSLKKYFIYIFINFTIFRAKLLEILSFFTQVLDPDSVESATTKKLQDTLIQSSFINDLQTFNTIFTFLEDCIADSSIQLAIE